MASPELHVFLYTGIETAAFPTYHQLSNVLVRHNNKILLLHRITEPFKDMWSIPGGGVEDGEAYVVTATRELYEEARITADKLHPLYVFIDHAHQLECHLYEYVSPDGTFENNESSEHDIMVWKDVDTALTLTLTPGLEEALHNLH